MQFLRQTVILVTCALYFSTGVPFASADSEADADSTNLDLEAHWSAGLQFQGIRRPGLEATLGPRLCEYHSSTDVCGVIYGSAGATERTHLYAVGVGYFGQGHGIPGGIFFDVGPFYEKGRLVARHRTLTLSMPPVFFPVFFRWIDGDAQQPKYSIGLTLKFVNMRGLGGD